MRPTGGGSPSAQADLVRRVSAPHVAGRASFFGRCSCTLVARQRGRLGETRRRLPRPYQTAPVVVNAPSWLMG